MKSRITKYFLSFSPTRKVFSVKLLALTLDLQKKHLAINLLMLRQAYKRHYNFSYVWIPRGDTFADAVTRKNSMTVWKTLLIENHLDLPSNTWAGCQRTRA